MSGLTMNGQPRRGTPADTDCIYCRNEVDVVTTYGTVVTPQRKCPQQRRPLVVAGLDADRTCGCGMSPDRAVTAAQWPVMTTTECADSGDSRTPSINVDDDLFLSLPCRTSAYYQRWMHATTDSRGGCSKCKTGEWRTQQHSPAFSNSTVWSVMFESRAFFSRCIFGARHQYFYLVVFLPRNSYATCFVTDQLLVWSPCERQ